MGEFCLTAGYGLDIDQHTFLSNSNCCGSIYWMETLQSLAASFDALGLDFARRAPYFMPSSRFRRLVLGLSTSPETGPLSHYFGWGCQADYRCYDQMTFTEPFYTSVAYSLGALWASRKIAKLTSGEDRSHDLTENRAGQEEQHSA